MRFIQIVFFLILFSCSNSNSETEHTSSEGSSANSGVISTDGVDVPIMGGPAHIEMSINNAPDAKSYLIASVAGSNFRMDSTEIKAGKLELKKADGYPQGLYYFSLPNKQYVQFFLAEDQEFKMQFDANDMTGSMQVSGSKENEIFYQNLKFEADYNTQYQAVLKEMAPYVEKTGAAYEALDKKKRALEKSRQDHLESLYKGNEGLLFVSFKKAGQNPVIREELPNDQKVYFYRKEFWDNVDFSDRRLIRTPVVSNKLKRYIKELTPQNGDSLVKYSSVLIDKTLPYPEYFKYISNWIAIEYDSGKTTLMDPEKIFVHLTQNYFTRERAFWADSMEVFALQQRAGEMAQSLVGLQGPDVVSTDENGNTQSIYSKTADYIVVYMYNPTCEHCMKETPQLVEWYKKNKNSGVDVFAIAIDTDKNEWTDYIEKNGMEFTNVFDPTNESIYAKYYVNVTPEIYLLNKERKIIAKNLKVFQIDEMINRDRSGQ